MTDLLILKQSGLKYGIPLGASNASGGDDNETNPEPPESPEQPYIPTLLNFSYQGGSQSLSVEHSGNWTILQNGTWFTVSALSGTGNINATITVPANATMNIKNGSITLLLSNGISHEISIKQGISQEILTAQLLPFDYMKDHTVSISVTSNTSWIMEHNDEYGTNHQSQTYSGNYEFYIQRPYSFSEYMVTYRFRTVSNSIRYEITIPKQMPEITGSSS